jgi:acetyl esterase/lipase
MDQSLVAPELRHMVRGNPFVLLEYGWARTVTRILTRLMPPVKMEGVTITTMKGPPPLRVYRPDARRTDACLLWIHGGGYVVGSARANDFSCSDICRTLGITVVSVDYRLAPEHPFPIPSDDCLAAWHWLQQLAPSLGIDPGLVAIGGASAGGGLAAGIVQRIRDAGGQQPIAQWLLAPMLDDRTGARRELDAIQHPIWNNRMNRAAWRSYLATEPGTENIPSYAAPARSNSLAGLPPTFIGAGDIDLFYEEDRIYAERLRQHGVPVAFETVHGAPHGFEELARETDIAKVYLARAQDWLRSTIGAGKPPASARKAGACLQDGINSRRSSEQEPTFLEPRVP